MSQAPFNPQLPFSSGPNEALHYNNAGNAFAQDASGLWVPHQGIAQPVRYQASTACESAPSHQVSQRHNGPIRCTFETPLTMTAQPVIDLALVALPASRDDDLTDGPTIAAAIGYQAATSVAGVRHSQPDVVSPKKGKGKGKEAVVPEKLKKHTKVIDLEDDLEDEPKTKRGCPQGANNYSARDTDKLLDCVAEELPHGQCGWQAVAIQFNKWAVKSGRPECKVMSLETKFKQLVKTMKPTGDGVCPPDAQCAHEIDDLDDLEFNDGPGFTAKDKLDLSDDNEDPATNAKPSRYTATAHSSRTEAPSTRCTSRCAAASDLMQHLSNAFDPEVQRTHDKDRANHSFATMQYLTLSQQLQEERSKNDRLQNVIYNLRGKLQEARLEYNNLQMRLEVRQMQAPGGSRQPHQRNPWRHS